jgi:hypothetical protein
MAAMLPIQHKHIFRSRWVALLWAAGILWFAYDVASSEPADDDNNMANSAQVEQALNAF